MIMKQFDYEIKKYPDGTRYVNYFNHYNSVHWGVFRINSYEDLWHLNQLVDAANAINTRPRIMIPNLLDAQADRRFQNNQSSGLKLVCRFLNGMDADFHIFHPHNPEVVEAMMDNVVITDNSKFIKDILYQYEEAWSSEDSLILMSSDAGGFKPLMKLCDNLNWQGEVYSASKSREYKNGSTQLIQIIDRQDFGGKDILIIDDISVFGGTFKGLSVMLKRRNVGKLYLAVSHMTMQNLGDDPVTDYFDRVFTTNSKYDEYFVPNKKGEPTQPKNLNVIKLF